MKKILFYLCILVCLVNCSGKKKMETQAVPSVKKGDMVILHCLSAPEDAYTLYFPVNSKEKTRMPLCIFLDSHGKGMLPVQLYKTLSEEYGFIFAGSKVIRNGMDINEVIEHYFNLLQDVKKRCELDSSRIYIAGFSGGARMASLLAVTQSNIAGIITCSAGMDNSLLQNQPSFDVVGITGISDMNYSELTTTDKHLEQIGAVHQLLVFDDKHEWPPVQTMREALLFTTLTAMKKHPEQRNDTVIGKAKEYFLKKISINKNDKLTYLRLLQQMTNYLNGLQDMTPQKEEVAKLMILPEIQAALEKEKQIEKQENEYKQKIINAFAEKKIEWWRNEVFSLQEKISKSPRNEAAMYRRILGFASLASFSNVNYAIKNRNLEMANHFLQIYALADPGNPDCAYFYACYYALKQDKVNAIKNLNEAVDKGFNDVDRLMQETCFNSSHNSEEFIAVKKRIVK